MTHQGERPFGAPDLLGALHRWIAEARVDDAAKARARTRWLRQQAAEETTFASVLTDLAERGRPVLVQTTTGRRHRGSIVAVGVDFVGVDTEPGAVVLVATDAICAVRAEPHGDAAASGRMVFLELELAHAIAELAPDRPRVAVTMVGGEPVTGELRSVGRDVATIRLDGGTATLVYVPLSAVAELWCPQG